MTDPEDNAETQKKATDAKEDRPRGMRRFLAAGPIAKERESKMVGGTSGTGTGAPGSSCDSTADAGDGRTFAGLPAARGSSIPGAARSVASLPWWLLLVAGALIAGSAAQAQEATTLGLGTGATQSNAYFPPATGQEHSHVPAWMPAQEPAVTSGHSHPPGGRYLQESAANSASADSLRGRVYPGEKLVFWDDFDTLEVGKVWKPEITMGGFGNWEFQVYWNNRSNLFVRDGSLYLKATPLGLPDAAVKEGYTMDLWGTDPPSLCTANAYWGCMRTSGAGGSIINPVASARVRTAETFSFKYGRVEVRAKLPKGDWLWPAIWMLPRHQVYGPWPASGEIDIMESRGNAPGYVAGGHNTFGSTLHVGPSFQGNLWQKFHKMYTAPGTASLADDYHIYGLLWEPSGLYTYIDSPSNKVLTVSWDNAGGAFGIGGFPPTLDNPWASSTNIKAAPFDQEFYLIMNLAVGGTAGGAQGYFPDGPGKPWKAGEAHPMNSFWEAREKWLPTWQGNGAALAVDWVRVWQREDGLDGSSASGPWLTQSGLLPAALGDPARPSTLLRPQEVGGMPVAQARRMTGGDALPCDASDGGKLRVTLHVNVSRGGVGDAGGPSGGTVEVEQGQEGRGGRLRVLEKVLQIAREALHVPALNRRA